MPKATKTVAKPVEQTAASTEKKHIRQFVFINQNLGDTDTEAESVYLFLNTKVVTQAIIDAARQHLTSLDIKENGLFSHTTDMGYMSVDDFNQFDETSSDADAIVHHYLLCFRGANQTVSHIASKATPILTRPFIEKVAAGLGANGFVLVSADYLGTMTGADFAEKVEIEVV